MVLDQVSNEPIIRLSKAPNIREIIITIDESWTCDKIDITCIRTPPELCCFIFHLFCSVFSYVFIICRLRCVVVGNGHFKRSIYSDSNIWTTAPQPETLPSLIHTLIILLSQKPHARTPFETRNREMYEIGRRACYLYQQVYVRSRATHVDTRPTSNLFPSSDSMCVAWLLWYRRVKKKKKTGKIEKRTKSDIIRPHTPQNH